MIVFTTRSWLSANPSGRGVDTTFESASHSTNHLEPGMWYIWRRSGVITLRTLNYSVLRILYNCESTTIFWPHSDCITPPPQVSGLDEDTRAWLLSELASEEAKNLSVQADREVNTSPPPVTTAKTGIKGFSSAAPEMTALEAEWGEIIGWSIWLFFDSIQLWFISFQHSGEWQQSETFTIRSPGLHLSPSTCSLLPTTRKVCSILQIYNSSFPVSPLDEFPFLLNFYDLFLFGV